MSSYFAYYAESNIVCLIIFGIMLGHDLLNTDRQEKQLKYDHALIALMLYFISDTIWAGVDSGTLPVNAFTVIATNFSNYVIMAAVTYTWLRFVMAVEQVPHREEPLNRLAMAFPFIASTVVYIGMYLIAPHLLLDANLQPQLAMYAFLIVVPDIYIIAVMFYALGKARHESNPVEMKKHIYIGFFPLMVIVCGMIEVLFLPTSPVFCFSCTILMLVFYIQSMDAQISRDPLTGLNNRGQLLRYTSQQHSNANLENRLTYFAVMDIDDFKMVNDTYGHAEGDKALIIVATALQNTVKRYTYPIFLCRFGGDEFVLIAHPESEAEFAPLIDDIRTEIEAECKARKTPYLIAISAGYDKLSDSEDTYQKCAKRADHNLYLEKARRKSGRKPEERR